MPLTSMRALYALELLELGGMAVYLGRVDDDTVTTAICYQTHEDAGIFRVATLP